MDEQKSLIPLTQQSLESSTVIDGEVQALPSLADSVFRAYERDLTAETRRRHYHDLEVFCAFLWVSRRIKLDHEILTENLEAWRMVAPDAVLLREYLDWQMEEGYALSSVNVRFSTVKAYCRLLMEAQILDGTTWAQILAVKSLRRDKFRTIDKNRTERGLFTRRGSKKAEPVYLTRAQVTQLLQGIGDETKEDRRDNLLVRLAWFHALRVSEVVALTIAQFDLGTGILTFDRPKTHLYNQRIKLSDKTLAIVGQVIEDRKAETTMNERIPLFASFKPRHYGEEPSERTILPQIASARIARLVQTILDIEHVSMHDGRHFFANEVFADPNISLADGMDAAGWRTPAMALGYRQRLKIANSRVKDLEEE